MNKKFLSAILFGALMVGSTSTFVSCKDYDDDIDGLHRCSKDDNAGKKSLIGFLVRNNVLPKYGFPVDTVELIPDINARCV